LLSLFIVVKQSLVHPAAITSQSEFSGSWDHFIYAADQLIAQAGDACGVTEMPVCFF